MLSPSMTVTARTAGEGRPTESVVMLVILCRGW